MVTSYFGFKLSSNFYYYPLFGGRSKNLPPYLGDPNVQFLTFDPFQREKTNPRFWNFEPIEGIEDLNPDAVMQASCCQLSNKDPGPLVV